MQLLYLYTQPKTILLATSTLLQVPVQLPVFEVQAPVSVLVKVLHLQFLNVFCAVHFGYSDYVGLLSVVLYVLSLGCSR